MPDPRWMIYGANGFTGERIARRAAEVGMRPILAGRSEEKVARLAEELGLDYRAFDLDGLRNAPAPLEDIDLVLNCAGPFSQTAAPLIDASLAARNGYLDITGEIEVIEYAAGADERARQADVCLMPAVGFDVVPSDCLAALLAAEASGEAEKLELAFAFRGRASRGTALTTWEQFPRGGRIRRNGKIVRVPTAWRRQAFPFPGGMKRTMTIPWGDVASAYYTTGVPNIEVYVAVPKPILFAARWLRWTFPLFGLPPFSALGRRVIRRRISGPSEAQMRHGAAEFFGRLVQTDGRRIEATLTTPDPYALTVETALAAVRRTLAGDVAPGFTTPGQSFGGNFVLDFDGVRFTRIGEGTADER